MMAKLCEGPHRWALVRKYIGFERYAVNEVEKIDPDNGPIKVDLEELQPGDDWEFDVYLRWEADSDEYDQVLEEWLSCDRCEAEIRGNRIGEIN